MKKILMFTLVVSCLGILTGCGKNDDNEISYTNKYECTKSVNFTKMEYDNSKSGSGSKKPVGGDTSPQAVENIDHIIYDFNKDGSKLLNYYVVREYEYLIDYNMEEEKEYFSKQCDSIDKKTYKSCDVTIKDKTITITMKVDIDSESNKESASKITLNSVKEGFSNNPAYTCK